MSLGDTIAAVATAPGRGGVAVIRVSGPEAFQVAERLTGRASRAGRISLDHYRRDGHLLDDGVTLAFKGPHSYTGEDVVEFQCHGGSVTPRRVLEACLASGARLAHRGEFTERAFLNGRLSYEEAESVLDLVDAKTERGADAALRGLTGESRRETQGIYKALVDLSSTIEHALDVSEEELPDGFCANIASSVDAIAARLDDAIRRAKEGKILREGALVVIAGPPNAGKSSLLNALLGESRAIVSATPGTTRDSIEEWLDVGGWPVRLVDTAGLRETADAIEGEGVVRARDLMKRADIVLNLTPADSSCSLSDVSRKSPATKTIEVCSKCDLATNSEDYGSRYHSAVSRSTIAAISVSVKTGEGLDALRGAIAAALERKAAEPSDADSALARDAAALVETRALLTPTPPLPNSSTPTLPDLVLLANRVRAAAERLGEAIGATYSADMLNALFSRFCVGK
ncbi:MAG: tRNA uridine-5-carboxymethylaminomethyl(34) synthesis GTPase MnmE [Kiritimatiellae bacterium]|nr:tRNA uridine-5-carboxymethylaminomethyl(34) synthesis GTPase MnmE [Kiritimatiellia bacterium]